MKVFDDAMVTGLIEQAKASPRLRANYNVHEALEDPVQRLFIAIEPGSYVRPHRHPEPEKWEFFMVLRGRLALLIFDDDGKVLRREELAPGSEAFGGELPPNTWHSVVALESGSVFIEFKQGPYAPFSDKNFAAWAPSESEADTAAFCLWMSSAQMGDSASAR